MSLTSIKLLPIGILLAALVISILVGLMNRSHSRGGYGIEGRPMGHAGIGMAIASNWMSAASFLGIAGIFFVKGYFAFAYILGWTGGYVLLLVLMGGQLRRFGKYTAPDFVEARFESSGARICSAAITILISLIYCVAQYKGIGLIFGWILGIDYTGALLLGTLVVISYLVLAGSLGARKNQRFHYLLLIVSFVVPLMFLADKLGYSWLMPQFSYGTALRDLPTPTAQQYLFPWTFGTPYQWIALSVTLMVGTAGLPHVLSRFYTAPNNRDARWGVVWGLFFIGLLYWSAPAFGAFAKAWQAQTGNMLEPEAARAIADLIVVKAGEWAGIPEFLVAILAVGGILAAFSTVTGLLITGAGAFAYDIYFRLINPRASEQHLVKVAKGVTLLMALLILVIAANPPGLIAEITAVAFALAGNTLFPVFLLGIWWDRTNSHGVIAGMTVGIIVTFIPVLFGHMLPGLLLWLPATSSALIGAPLVILVIIVTSLLTPPPSDKVRRFLIEKVHSP